MFAEVAAVGRVGLIIRVVYFVSVDELVRDRKPIGDGEGVLSLEIGIARTFGRHGQGATPELICGDVGEIRAVDAAREGDYHRSHLAQDASKLSLFSVYPVSSVCSVIFSHGPPLSTINTKNTP